ncbi:hypothetical protein Sbal117_4691 (plasmid) [Shewanella baltica OS117]|nr:hypothetical protein Sbal117_4691 [Shewanella baltica OS117]
MNQLSKDLIHSKAIKNAPLEGIYGVNWISFMARVNQYGLE